MLLIVTLVAVAVAIAAAAYAWRLADAERQRSEARVAALAAEIDRGYPAKAGLHREAEAGLHNPADAGLAYPAEAGLYNAADAGLGYPAKAGLYGEAAPAMFEPAPRSGLQGRPLLKVGVGFAMAVLVIVLIAMSGERERAAADGPRAATQEQPGQGLELLSMRHARAGDALTVTGLVRNRGTAPSGSIMAVVFVFDRDGAFVASGRAPLEFNAIAPGDESPFRVTIPEVKDVGRYSLSFRTQAGIVPHVDRRATLRVSN
jgi:hypothetical protein